MTEREFRKLAASVAATALIEKCELESVTVPKALWDSLFDAYGERKPGLGLMRYEIPVCSGMVPVYVGACANRVEFSVKFEP